MAKRHFYQDKTPNLERVIEDILNYFNKGDVESKDPLWVVGEPIDGALTIPDHIRKSRDEQLRAYLPRKIVVEEIYSRYDHEGKGRLEIAIKLKEFDFFKTECYLSGIVRHLNGKMVILKKEDFNDVVYVNKVYSFDPSFEISKEGFERIYKR